MRTFDAHDQASRRRYSGSSLIHFSQAGSLNDPQQCPEKQALSDGIRGAIDLIFSIHDEELQDLVSGCYTNALPYLIRLREVRRRKKVLIEVLRNHINEHGC